MQKIREEGVLSKKRWGREGCKGGTSGENSIGPGMKSFGRTRSLSYPPMGDENWVTLREKTVGAAERREAWDAELATVAAMARRAAENTEDMMLEAEDPPDPSATTHSKTSASRSSPII